MPKRPYPKWWYGVAAGVWTLFIAVIIVVALMYGGLQDGEDEETRGVIAGFDAAARTSIAEVEEARAGWDPAVRTAIDNWLERRDASKRLRGIPTAVPRK